MAAIFSSRKFLSPLVISVFALGFVALLPKSALAQDHGQDDPPGRVGRLNFTQGSVSYQVSGDQDWVEADPNRPLTTGDNLWVDKDSRGEVHIGSTAVRMSSQTGISFLTLDDRTVQLQLAQGLIEVHLRRLSPGDAFEIDTPNLAFTLARGGEYRIAADPDGGSTVITVREGEGEVTGAGQTWDLRAGQTYTFGGGDDLSYDAAAASGYDDFENWCQSRDQRENASQSAKYVSRDVDGYYDLDEYGDWQTDPDYGAVWIPRGVAAGWAPYQVGHWVYVAPWGWTWVDAEPWGFAPFHYGRWAFVGGYWGWVPGPVVVRPVYAPALVGFVGGAGFGVSVAFGGGIAGVGWFPLGPRDVFVPAYRTSPRYFQNINVTNTRIVNVTEVTNVYNTVYINRDRTVVNNYTYARNQTAVTAVSRDTFVNARPVAGAQVRVSAEQIQSARAVETAPIAPTRSSYVSSSARLATNRPAVPFAQRPVVARLTPAVTRPAPQPSNRPGFHSFSNNNRDTTNRDTGSGANPPIGNANNGQPNQQASRDGYRRFQQPAGSANGTNSTVTNSQTDRSTNRNDQTTAGDQRQPMRFAPAAKARDEDYDVHPPLNPQNQSQAKEQPKQEQKQEQHQEKENKKDDDKKDEK
jgi:Family of unknown function (DUF6600)